ncbi:MAG: restriction endonuclease subunit S [Dehalococcoidia bacterium]|nr:restriction endonuclease subunit S [Dehalococcoidia bacterium]
MAGEWRKTTVGEFAPFAYGKGLPEPQRDPLGNVPVFGSNGIVGFHSEGFTSGPTIIIGRKGTVGAVHFSPKGCWPIDTTFFVVDEDHEIARFKYYLLKSLDLEHMNADSAVPGLNREAAHARQVRVPPLPEQRAIAHILGTLDDKIELNRRMTETLEAMARALFKSWFVDFEPVRAKMEGRWRRGESLPGLPAHLHDLFPARLVDSELGEIPEGWEVASLPELIEINPPRVLRKGEIAPYLDMANMPTRGHAPSDIVERAFGSGMRFTNGDTLVAPITPCLENGKTAFVDFLQNGQIGWGSTEYIVLRPRPPLPEEFAYCLARSDTFREFAIQSMTGTSGRQRVQADSLAHFPLPRVPEPVAEAFGCAIKPLFARSSAAVRESRTLVALRDALLPKLISGELRVQDAERFLEDTVA